MIIFSHSMFQDVDVMQYKILELQIQKDASERQSEELQVNLNKTR